MCFSTVFCNSIFFHNHKVVSDTELTAQHAIMASVVDGTLQDEVRTLTIPQTSTFTHPLTLYHTPYHFPSTSTFGAIRGTSE